MFNYNFLYKRKMSIIFYIKKKHNIFICKIIKNLI